MNTLALYLPTIWPSIWTQITSRLTKRLFAVLILLLLVWILTLPVMVSAYAGLGGYISEKMLGDGTDSSLYLGDSASGPVVLGTIPIITTLPVTDAVFPDAGPATATLRGQITDLNGMPSATYWFVWGYAAGALVNTTAVTPTVGVGIKTTVLAGYDPGLTVFYQFRAGTDGTTRGGTGSFAAGGGRGTAYWLLRNILTLIIALGILIVAIMVARTGNWVAALILMITGLIALTIVREILLTMIR